MLAAAAHGSWRIFGLKWVLGVSIIAAIDGAFLGGVAAVISAIGTFIIGVLAFSKGHSMGRATEADAWRQLAEARKEQLDKRDGDD